MMSIMIFTGNDVGYDEVESQSSLDDCNDYDDCDDYDDYDDCDNCDDFLWF